MISKDGVRERDKRSAVGYDIEGRSVRTRGKRHFFLFTYGTPLPLECDKTLTQYECSDVVSGDSTAVQAIKAIAFSVWY